MSLKLSNYEYVKNVGIKILKVIAEKTEKGDSISIKIQTRLISLDSFFKIHAG